jgi:hypothetical protein
MKSMMKRLFLVALMLLCISSARAQEPLFRTALYPLAQTSGTVSITQRDFGPSAPLLRIVTLDWTSDTSGSLVASLPALWGTVERVVTNPDGGSDAPDDDYDLTWADEDGADLLAAAGQNRDTSNTEQFCPRIGNGTGVNGLSSPGGTQPVVVGGTTTLTIANAGSGNKGRVRIYLRR